MRPDRLLLPLIMSPSRDSRPGDEGAAEDMLAMKDRWKSGRRYEGVKIDDPVICRINHLRDLQPSDGGYEVWLVK